MRKISVVFFILLPSVVAAQSGDGGSGWANWLLNQAQWVKQEIRDNESVAKTIELVRLYKETQQLTGIVASTVTDLKNATVQFQKDVKTIDDITESQLDQLNNYFSWEESLSGRGYPSLLNLEDWYRSGTTSFRDREGHLNAASLLFNTVSVEDQKNKQREYNATIIKIRAQKGIYMDEEISRLFKLANEKDNQARHLVIKLNMEVFKKGMGNLMSKLGKQFSGNPKNSAENDEDDKQGKGKDSNSNRLSQEEVNKLIAEVYTLRDDAAKLRYQAIEMIDNLMRMEMNSATVDLLVWRRLKGIDGKVPEIVVPDDFNFPEKYGRSGGL